MLQVPRARFNRSLKGSARIYSPALADRGTPNSTSLRLNGLAALLCIIKINSALFASSMPGHGLLVSPASSLSFLSNKSKTFLKHVNYSFFTLNSSLNRGAAVLATYCQSSAVPAPVAHITSIVFVYRFHKPVCRKGFFYLFFRIE